LHGSLSKIHSQVENNSQIVALGKAEVNAELDAGGAMTLYNNQYKLKNFDSPGVYSDNSAMNDVVSAMLQA
jgi:hypothetical protein